MVLFISYLLLTFEVKQSIKPKTIKAKKITVKAAN